jgi:hypothetical protein
MRQWIASARSSGATVDSSARVALSPVSGRCDQPTIADPRGDGRVIDIVSTSLTSDCGDWTITTTFARPIDISRLDAWWLHLAPRGAVGKGCRGAHFMMVAFVERGRPTGYVLHTPTCRVNDWTTWASARIEQPNSRTLRTTIAGSTFGQPQQFRWRTGADATKTRGWDDAPDTGWVDAVPGAQAWLRTMKVSINRFVSTARLDWDGSWHRSIRYTLTITENGGPPTTVWLPDTTATDHTLTDLTPGSTYDVSLTAWVRGVEGGTARFTMPEAAP